MKTSLLLPLLSAATLPAQEFTIDWSTIDGGGTPPSGGAEFTLTGSIGQFDAGPAPGTGASEFSLIGGYWAAEESPLDLGLSMQRNGGTVTLTWDGTRGIPIVLERSADLRTWLPLSPQPAGPPHTENVASVTRRYYRLRRQ